MNNQVVIVGTTSDVTLNVKTPDGQTVATEISHPIADLGGQDAVVVAVAQGEIDAKQSGSWNINVSNFPADPASGTNQIAANGKLDTIGTNTGTTATKVTSIDNKTPALTSAPTTLTNAVPVCQIPDFVPGKQLHVQTSAGIANGANKLLFGFNNDTGLACYVTRVHAANMQTTSISGVFSFLYVRRGTGLITLGSGATEITGVTSPALITAMRDPAYSVPVGFTFWTGGSLGGTISTIESARWTTDEVSPNGSGLSEMILAQGNYQDLWDFSEDPVVVPDQYSLAVVCDSTTTNGSTLVDFNIRFGV